MTTVTKLLEYIRKHAYWSIDFIKGSPIKKHFNEINHIIENPNALKTRDIKETNLNKLLSHATHTTRFYEKYKNYSDLYDFPLTNKNIVLENYEDFKSKVYQDKKLYKVSSSGSTGIPFSIYQNKNKKNRNTADTIYFSQSTGASLGDELIYLKLWDHTNHKSKWGEFSQNIIAHNIMDSSDEEITSLIKRIEKSKSNKSILGYPSFFEQVCRYMEKLNYSPKNFNIKSIISFAEGLNNYEREKMAFYFNAPVYERYSNQENGILAQQTKNSKDKYQLNWASYFIEVLEPNSDKHVEPGKLGRIVITDLFNYSMPLIRYDTGDMAIYEKESNQHPSFSKIYGRRNHMIYSETGKIVSPFIFYMVLEYSKAKQFQFKQTGEKNYLFILNGEKENTRENDIINYFKGYLGDNSNITFEYVQEIPVLSSGKRIKVINEWALKN